MVFAQAWRAILLRLVLLSEALAQPQSQSIVQIGVKITRSGRCSRTSRKASSAPAASPATPTSLMPLNASPRPRRVVGQGSSEEHLGFSPGIDFGPIGIGARNKHPCGLPSRGRFVSVSQVTSASGQGSHRSGSCRCLYLRFVDCHPGSKLQSTKHPRARSAGCATGSTQPRRPSCGPGFSASIGLLVQ